MYLWIHKKAKYFSLSRKYQRCVICGGNQCRVQLELSMKEISVTFRLANCHGYMNQHLVRSYICACQTLIMKYKVKQSANKNKTRKCFVQFTKSCRSVFSFIVSLMALFTIAVPLPQQLSMKLTISLLLKNTIDLLFFSEHKLYGFPQSVF